MMKRENHKKPHKTPAAKLYLHYISIQIRSLMQYKKSFIMNAMGQFLASFNAFVGIHFLFMRFHSISGYTYGDVLLCFSVVQMEFSLAECVARGFDSFSKIVRQGTFDRIMTRPRNEILQVLGSSFELTRIGRTVQAALIFDYGTSHAGIEWSFSRVLTVLFMLIGGTGVFSGIFLINAALCFFTLEGLEFINIFTDGAREYGQYPIDVYGKRMTRFCTAVIPYTLVQLYPLHYLTGRSDSILYMLLPLAGLFFLVPCYALWRFGVRKYKSSGS